jgi:Rps23 Pro-64 3,4-dihydroxylase Tpa1-like proline 4-hydroxylase
VLWLQIFHVGAFVPSVVKPVINPAATTRSHLLEPLKLSSSTTIPRITTDAIKDLKRNGYVVLKNFIPSELALELKADVANLRSQGKFKIAKIGQDSTNTLNTDIRIAETCFIGQTKLQQVPNTARQKLYDVLDGVRSDLSGNTLLDEIDSNDQLRKAAPSLDASLSELLYAYYPLGGFYRRHVDSVQNSASVLRTYSLLLYLNDEWKESDGGCLRIHLDSGGDFLPLNEEPNFVDVEPRASTLVLFKSDKIPHEVLDTTAERNAVVGWFNRPFSSADISSLASESDKIRGAMLAVAAGLVTFGVISIISG